MDTPVKLKKPDNRLRWLIVLSIVYGIVFLSLNILRFKSFFSYEWEDEAAENQLIYNIAAFSGPHQTIFQGHVFLDHFTPVYFLVAVFYKIFPHIYTLFFLESFAYGFCSILIYLLAREMLKEESLAFIISLSYLVYPPLHYVNLGSLDGNIFSLPLLAVTIYAMQKKKFFLYLFFMFFSSLCKEDISLVIFLLGFYQLLNKFGKKWWLLTFLFSISYLGVYVLFLNKVCILRNFESDPSQIDFCNLDLFTLKSLFKFIAFHSTKATGFLFSAGHLRVFFMILYPLLFLPLFSSEMYIPLVMFGEVLLSQGAYNHDSYYLAPIIPFLFFSLISFLKKIKTSRLKLALSLLVFALCFFSNFPRSIVGDLPGECGCPIFDGSFAGTKNVFDKRIFTLDEEDKLAWEFIRQIPAKSSVTASGDLLPALSCRKYIYEFALNDPDAFKHLYLPSEYNNYNVEYVLIHKKYLPNGLSGYYAYLAGRDLEKEINNYLDNHQFEILKRKDNFILLKRKTVK
ncbi:MAG: DUF2079 domain-containing protein [Candidatus Omnitrophica bacterium]|nr:DUF2079 domain-containing protein [Candidatus Omnitrophota bacterium]